MERKPSASLMNARENPVLQNMSGKPGVAGNPDKPLGNAKEVKLPENPKWFPREDESSEIDKLTFKEVSLSGDMADFDKHREAMQLTETDSYLGQDIVEDFKENTRLLTEADYKGKTPKYVAENYSLEQIEKTLKELGIQSAPGRSVKGKAADLINGTK